MGLSHQAVAQASPVDNLQAESHQVYELLLAKHREALKAVQTYVNSKTHWVTLMKGSMMDDAAESAVHIHADKPPEQVSTVKAKIKNITAGIWDMLKRLTEQLAPSVVRTPATVATKVAQEPEIDPEEFEDSVPENTLITLTHNRRFDWIIFARDLLLEVMKVPKEQKPAINHKAPSLFVWHESQAWDPVSRISHKFETPVPDPWTCDEYLNLANAGHMSMEKSNSKEPAALNNWIYTWAYIKVPAQNEDQTPTAYSLSAYLTILWMSGLLKASEKTKTSIDRLFSDGDRSDLFRFLAKCNDIIDPAQLGKPLGHTLQALRSSRQRRILQVDTKTCNGELVGAKPNVTGKVGPPLVQRFGMGRVPVSDEVPLSTPGGFCVSTWTCWFETSPADPGLSETLVLAQSTGG